MLAVETTAKIRRPYFGQGKPIKKICRELGISPRVHLHEVAGGGNWKRCCWMVSCLILSRFIRMICPRPNYLCGRSVRCDGWTKSGASRLAVLW